MHLRKISILNFKNIADAELELSEGINCFTGDNGAGKTNVLDAVYYMSMSKSSFSMTDGQSLRHDEEFFVLDGAYRTDEGKSENIVCTFSHRTGKTMKRNGKEYERMSDHIGLIPAVMVSPADSALITDSADERRRYLNAFISQLDRTYLRAVMRYKTVLQERNTLLKMSQDTSMLDIYDARLTELADTIYRRRREMVEALRPLTAEYYAALSGDREQVELSYRSDLDEAPMERLLLESRERDFVNRYTSRGVHRDDMVLKIGGYPLRKYGSQGQQKSFLLALKLAQYSIVADRSGERPILLLDDLFDKLDMNRVEELLRLVSGERFGQIFITDCNKVRLQSVLDKAHADYALFTVSNGAIRNSEFKIQN